MKKYSSLFETAIGWGAVVADEAGLLEVFLPFEAKSRDEMLARAAAKYPGSAGESEVTRKTAARLSSYFAGDRVDFSDLTIDLSRFTSFQRMVYETVASIPRGEVRTYGEIAAKIGNPRAARGIGTAMGRNPLPVIIPCHRVVGASGGMTGYSAPGGIVSKKWLLRLEGAKLTESGRISRSCWQSFSRIISAQE